MIADVTDVWRYAPDGLGLACFMKALGFHKLADAAKAGERLANQIVKEVGVCSFDEKPEWAKALLRTRTSIDHFCINVAWRHKVHWVRISKRDLIEALLYVYDGELPAKWHGIDVDEVVMAFHEFMRVKMGSDHDETGEPESVYQGWMHSEFWDLPATGIAELVDNRARRVPGDYLRLRGICQ